MWNKQWNYLIVRSLAIKNYSKTWMIPFLIWLKIILLCCFTNAMILITLSLSTKLLQLLTVLSKIYSFERAFHLLLDSDQQKWRWLEEWSPGTLHWPKWEQEAGYQGSWQTCSRSHLLDVLQISRCWIQGWNFVERRKLWERVTTHTYRIVVL